MVCFFCSSLTELNLSSATYNKVTTYIFMFNYTPSLTKIIIKGDDKAEEFINARLADVGETGVTVERFKA